MTDRERKDYYISRIKKVLASRLNVIVPGFMEKHLEEEMKIIMWNNNKNWTKTFMNEEVIPLLNKYGIHAKSIKES